MDIMSLNEKKYMFRIIINRGIIHIKKYQWQCAPFLSKLKKEAEATHSTHPAKKITRSLNACHTEPNYT